MTQHSIHGIDRISTSEGERAVAALLRLIGEDPERDGLRDTPARVVMPNQERMTQQIAQSVEAHLEARGVGVIVAAHHLCMGCRGVKVPATQLVTSAMLGTLRTSAETRSELLRLCGTT